MKKCLLIMLLVFSCLAVSAEGYHGTEWIEIADGAMLPADASVELPAVIMRGALSYDEEELIARLLGDDYLEKQSYSKESRDYVTNENKEPWEIKYVYINEYVTGYEFFYSDPWVAGERGGEYEPPQMNMMPSESALYARALLSKYFHDDMLNNVSVVRQISERWSYKDRWYTDMEYQRFQKQQQVHYIVFDHHTKDGVPILNDSLMGIVGVNGLSGFSLSWHDFDYREETIQPMPLQDAINLASTTRSRKTTLLYAELCYSNWLTDWSDEYHLSWYLVTADGDYVVDTVLNKHMCTMYEY